MSDDGGKKHDGGKDPWHLLPTDAIRCVVRVLKFGANKYAERNWEKGIAHSRTYAATLRHVTSWWEGEDRDPETGESHLAHAACEILFALAFEVRGRSDLDDRPRVSAPVLSVLPPLPGEFPEPTSISREFEQTMKALGGSFNP